MAISRAQFGELAGQVNVPGGGFSINTRTGVSPTRGYMVAIAGSGQQHEAPVTGEDVESFAKVARLEHGRRARGYTTYLGGWHKEADPTGPAAVFFDRSMNIVTPGPLGRAEATVEMARQGQRSMYHVGAGVIENNPFYGQEYPGQVQASIKRLYEAARGVG